MFLHAGPRGTNYCMHLQLFLSRAHVSHLLGVSSVISRELAKLVLKLKERTCLLATESNAVLALP